MSDTGATAGGPRPPAPVGPGATEPGGEHGGAITIEVDGDPILVDGALLSEADVEASNGLVHVIESVMLTEELVGSP